MLLISISSRGAQVTQVRTPLFFEPNGGQAPPEVMYLLREGRAEAAFGAHGFTLALPSGERGAQFVGFDFSGEAGAPVLTPAEKLGGRTNYLEGNDAARWVRNLPNYAQLRYAGVYPGIDVLFYGTGQRLEHDFEVAPGADAGRIALRVRGARLLSLTDRGDLRLRLAEGTVVLERPLAYQEAAGGRRSVRARYAIARDGTVRFRVGAYDRRRKLTIDPVLVFSTYVDTYPSYPYDVATDSAGNTYVAGHAFLFATTPGAYESSCSNCTYGSAYIAKLNATGSEEIYGTFVGNGQWFIGPNCLSVDEKGNAVMGGGGFIASLTADGSALNYSIPIPNGSAAGVATDSSGNAYVTGIAQSSEYSATTGALNAANANVFVSKITASGTIAYTAYIGNDENSRGEGPSGPMAIAVDASGSAYVTGSAGSLWPTSTGSYLAEVPAAGYGVFVARLHSDGSKLDYSTFTGVGNATAIAVDSGGDTWIAGQADTAAYPVTGNAYDSKGQANTGFLSEIGPDGTQLLYSSYFPTEPSFGDMNAVAIDQGGNVWLAGQAGQPQFPGNDGNVDPSTAVDSWFPLQHPLVSWGQSGFVTELNPTGTELEFSTLFGDGIEGLALDPQGRAHIAGFSGGSVYTSPNSFAPLLQYDPGDGLAFSFAAIIDASVAAPSICTNIPSFGDSPYYPVDQPGQMGQPPTTLQLTNCGNAALTFQSVTVSEPAYTIASSTCSGTMAVGDSCSIALNFSAAGAPSCNATLSIVSNASLPALVPLTLGADTGCAAAGAAASLSPRTLSFPSETVGVTSAPQTITLSNPGYVPLEVNQIAFTAGDFSETDNCGGTLKALGSCTISVTFSPLADGSRTATMGVFDSAGDSPEVVQLSGTGTGPAPAVSLSARALLFPAQTSGMPSAPQTLTVTNSGQGPLSISSIAASAPTILQGFLQTNNCPGLLAPGANCAISVTYTGDSDVGTLTITDNAGDSPQTVALLGAGESGVSLSANPASLTVAAAGGVVTTTITLTPLSSAGAGSYSLECALIWQGASTATPTMPACGLNPNPVNVTASGTTTLTISTAAYTGKASPGFLRRTAPILAAFLCFFMVPRRRWRGAARIVLVLAMVMGGISACSGGGPSTGGGGGGGGGGGLSATPGPYVVQVYSGGPGEAPVVLTTNVNLTVQ